MTRVVPVEQSPERLVDLGLTLEGLAAVLRGCLGAYLSCTSLDAPGRGPTEVYFEATRRLREWLLPLGWDCDNNDQQPRVFHRGRGVAIVFASGDSNTGKPLAHPKTRRAKGQATVAKIAANQLMLDFAGDVEAPTPSEFNTYLLLVDVDEAGLWAELSLPADMDASGFVDTWTERNLLQLIPRDPTPALRADDEGPSFDVAVVRR